MRASQTEREFFQIKAAGGSRDQITALKRKYFSSLFPILQGENTTTLTKRWLIWLIGQNAGTVSSIYMGDLLKSALTALGKSPTKNIKENWRQLYIALQ